MIPDYVMVPFGLFFKWFAWSIPYYFAVFYLIASFCFLYDINKGYICYETTFDKWNAILIFIFSPFITIFRLIFTNYRWI